MSDEKSDYNPQIIVRLAETNAEREAAQKLRYVVFYEEFGAKLSGEILKTKRDVDEFDEAADHMIVIDESLGNGSNAIIGTYRLCDQVAAAQVGRFYTSDEYDITPLLECGANLLELGRSCVLKPYRTRPVLQKLWQGIADYVLENEIEILFGCGSFHGTEPEQHAEALSYLHHYHLAAPGLRPKSLDKHYVNMNIVKKSKLNQKQILMSLPPLIKGYLRVGAVIGDGAYVDHHFNTTDVCIVLQTHLITDRYRQHYERKGNASFVTTTLGGV
jgi:putative hemolysin